MSGVVNDINSTSPEEFNHSFQDSYIEPDNNVKRCYSLNVMSDHGYLYLDDINHGIRGTIIKENSFLATRIVQNAGTYYHYTEFSLWFGSNGGYQRDCLLSARITSADQNYSEREQSKPIRGVCMMNMKDVSLEDSSLRIEGKVNWNLVY